MDLIKKYCLFDGKLEFNPFIIQQRKFCYNCYSSNINNKHKKFLICSRCKTAKYCNAKCQRENWKFHKHVCKNINIINKTKEEEINSLTAKQCINKLSAEHYSGNFSFKTSLYFKQIEHLIQTKKCKDPDGIGYDLHCHLIPNQYMMTNDFFHKFYASPGIPEFMFNSPLIKKTI